MKTTKRSEASAAAGVIEMVPLTSLFDPDTGTQALQDCLDKFRHHVSAIRVLIGHNEHYGNGITRQCILLARHYGIPTLTRVESDRVVITKGILPIYLDLCAETGINRIQFRKGNLHPDIKPREAIALADDRNLDVQFEIGNAVEPHAEGRIPQQVVDDAMAWLDSGAVNLVADVTRKSGPGSGRTAHESARISDAEFLASVFGLHSIMFQAPAEKVQQDLISHLGEETHLCDVPFRDVAIVDRLRSGRSQTGSYSSGQVPGVPYRGTGAGF